MEASKEGRDLTDFNYGCVGYSVYLDRIGKDRVADNQVAKAELPVCVGLEVEFSLSLCLCLRVHHFSVQKFEMFVVIYNLELRNLSDI